MKIWIEYWIWVFHQELAKFLVNVTRRWLRQRHWENCWTNGIDRMSQGTYPHTWWDVTETYRWNRQSGQYIMEICQYTWRRFVHSKHYTSRYLLLCTLTYEIFTQPQWDTSQPIETACEIHVPYSTCWFEIYIWWKSSISSLPLWN